MFSAVDGSAGKYSGVLSETVTLVPGDQYYMEITIIKGAGESESKAIIRLIKYARYYVE